MAYHVQASTHTLSYIMHSFPFNLIIYLISSHHVSHSMSSYILFHTITHLIPSHHVSHPISHVHVNDHVSHVFTYLITTPQHHMLECMFMFSCMFILNIGR